MHLNSVASYHWLLKPLLNQNEGIGVLSYLAWHIYFCPRDHDCHKSLDAMAMLEWLTIFDLVRDSKGTKQE
jgi:hypothetical protein